jgi:hypothetical protein
MAASLPADSGAATVAPAAAVLRTAASVRSVAVSDSLDVHEASGSAHFLQGQEYGTTGWFVGFEHPGNTTADPSLAVTGTRFVLATNSDIDTQVISNGPDDGRGIGHLDLHTLFGVPGSDEVIQPHLVYDQGARRFFLSAAEVDLGPGGAAVASRVWLAYSTNGTVWTPEPLTASSTTDRYDQPIIAADEDKVVVAFTAQPLGSGTPTGVIKVIQKSDLVTSGVLHQVTLTGPAVPAELAPAVTVTRTQTMWLVADQQNHVALLALRGTPDHADVTSTSFALPIIPLVPPPAPAQPFGKSVPIPLPRFVTAMWRSGTLWTTTVDGCTPPGSATVRACVRLLAIDAADPPSAPVVTHDFDIGDATMDYFAPAVASDGYRDIVVAASESNAYTDPTLVVFGERPPFTAINAQAEGLQEQYSEYNGPDWGGYSAVAIDPTDPASVWTDIQDTPRQGGDAIDPNWQTVGLRVLANTPTSWPGATPAYGTRYDDSATLIYRRSDGKLEWLRSYGPCPNCWSTVQDFTPYGGTTAAPALDPDLNFGNEYLFTRRADHHIWWCSALVGCTWYDLGGYATSAPTAVPAARGCPLSLFVRGRDGAVDHKIKTDVGTDWTKWRSLGGSVAPATQPGAVIYGNDHEAVFYRGNNNELYWKHSGNCGATWSRWTSLGGQTTSNPAASSVKQGTIDLFVRGTDNALHTRHLSGDTWSRWTNLGGSLRSGPAVGVPQTETTFPNSVPWGTEVIAVGADQHLWSTKRPVGGTWTGWHLLYWEGPGWSG